jgi:nicotinate-nucleotide pyrophosphorylase (carboxylating)
MLLEVLDEQLMEAVRTALTEDVGSGDITALLIPEGRIATATVRSREQAVICGSAWFNAVFLELDERVSTYWDVRDSDRINPDQILCRLRGPARALLTGERTALNFLQTLSATATCARRYADSVAGLPVRILDTRKTIPGLRAAQKYAVRAGGCHNHRTGLHDGVLIKENHISVAGSVTRAIQAARALETGLPVEIEVEDLSGLAEALDAGADIVLLDNFDTDTLKAAVDINAGRSRLEASGGVTLDNIRAIASTGVDTISVGALTKDIAAVDLSMRIVFDD